MLGLSRDLTCADSCFARIVLVRWDSPANIQQGEARILPCSAVSAFRIEAVPGGVESLAFDISTRQLTRMPARGRLTPAISLE